MKHNLEIFNKFIKLFLIYKKGGISINYKDDYHIEILGGKIVYYELKYDESSKLIKYKIISVYNDKFTVASYTVLADIFNTLCNYYLDRYDDTYFNLLIKCKLL